MTGWPRRLQLLDDLGEAGWIHLDPIHGARTTTVTTVVPRGFAAYVRVFHPTDSRRGALTWSEVARATGRTMHPLAQWERVSVGEGRRWGIPLLGQPPLEVLAPLVATLRGLTPTPDRCFFAVWDGWGQLHSSSFRSLRSGRQPTDAATSVEDFVAARERENRGYRRLELEPGTGRTYLLGTGPLDVVLELADDSDPGRPGVPAAMWWPPDHSWFVASEIDFDSTLVGGSAALRDGLLRNERLEALEVPVEGVLSTDGDVVNPPP